MLQGEHSAVLFTFIYLPLVIKIFVLSIFEWPLKTDFTVYIRGMIFGYQANVKHLDWFSLMAMSRSFFLTSRSILETVAVVRLVIWGRSTLLRLGLDPLKIDENKTKSDQTSMKNTLSKVRTLFVHITYKLV